MINTNFKKFKSNHKKKNNQVIYSSLNIKNENFLVNLIDNFLKVNNSFVFESVEKGIIRGRYTIIGLNPDKVWDINNNIVTLNAYGKKTRIKTNPLKHYCESIRKKYKIS